ncbi:MAG TPA: helix-turn-helix domain-containing protein [Solirubrobacterales bacterium]|nr:helix-turn-helix domain-containing protein [Solirubrobacterales bacterium]
MSAAEQSWDPPREPVADLIRAFAQLTLQDTGPVFEAVDRAVFEAAPERVLGEPALTEAFREANHANLTHWMAANVAAPGERVPPNVGPRTLELARDIVRRGYDDTSLNSYRVGQNAALRFVLGQVFEVTDDVGLVQELLEVMTRSIFAFVDDTLRSIEEQVSAERDQLARGTHAERLETVNLILEGAPIGAERATSRLGYELNQGHRALVAWADEPVEPGALERAADALSRAAGAARPLTVAASARSLWAWFPPAAEVEGGDGVAPVVDANPGVRVAIGSDERGMGGFRRSHFNALATQRLMQRARRRVMVASYPDVELVAITASDEVAAAEFTRRTLGPLAADEGPLRETVLAYVRADCNASAAAGALFAHRNTVLNRLDRARELLPGPLEGRALEVGLALEIDRWLGVSAPQP